MKSYQISTQHVKEQLEVINEGGKLNLQNRKKKNILWLIYYYLLIII